MAIKKHAVSLAAAFMLVAMFAVAVLSISNDTLTFDEKPHIGAGYSYLTQRDYRMNPEHPPLIKDLAAIPLLFLDLNFPIDSTTWTEASPSVWWEQYDFGTELIYNSGNDADQIVFWSRIPMMVIMILLGWLIFRWTRELWGNKASLIALFFYVASPTFLAHGRLVTTDVGAAFGVVLASYFWIKFLKNPTKKYVIFAGLAFGVAMLIKFSLVLLIPFFAIITLVWAFIKNDGKKLVSILKYSGLAVLAAVIGVVFVIWPVYAFHVSNYPQDRQIKDTRDFLATTNVPEFAVNFNVWLEQNNITRPLGQYLLGILTATNRTATGNTTYFMGQISADSWKSYFPTVYFMKNPLAFHILTIIAILWALWSLFKKRKISETKNLIKNHLPEFAMLTWLAIYWIVSLSSNLNIGVRHLMPIFPFTIMLVAAVAAKLLKEPWLKLKYCILGALFIAQIVSVAAVYPNFIAYFNETVGGAKNGI
jgi:4-amino-4-deoxy-L-arabinose transferase-like glycosyltransferase